MRRLLLLVLLFLPIAAVAQGKPAAPSDPELARKLAQIKDPALAAQAALAFRQRGDTAAEAEAWMRAASLRPHVGRYKLEAAAAYALQDKKSPSYTQLLELQGAGYAYDVRDDARFAKVATTEAWEFILKGFDANREPFGSGRVAYTLPKQDLLIESIAWDPKREQLLAGSAREGTVSRVRTDGKLVPLVKADSENGMWAVFDIVVDAQRGVLWVASTAVPHFKGYSAERDLGRAGVFKFDLASGKFLKKFLSPSIAGQSFFLSSLALGAQGEVYAADGVNNAVYMVRDDQFSRLFHAPQLGSIRGMTVSGDGKILYLGDHERGVIGFDLAAGRPFDVLVPQKLALGGIEGLAWWKGQLLLVQNDMEPNRIMRLKLDDAGRRVVGVQPLAANQEALSAPTMAALAGDTFYVIGNSQKGNYDRFGLVKDAAKIESTRIYAVDANFEPEPAKPPQGPQPAIVD